MCMGPELIIPAVLSGVGTVMNARAQQKAINKRNEVSQLYRQRNQKNQDKALAHANEAIESYNPASVIDELDKARSERSDTLMPTSAPKLDTDYAGSAPSAVKQNISRQIVGEVEKGRKESENLDRMRSYGDALYNLNTDMVRPRDKINMYGDFARGDNRSMQLEMAEAGKAGEGLNTIADLFKGAGQLSNMYFSTGRPSLEEIDTSKIPGKKKLPPGSVIS